MSERSLIKQAVPCVRAHRGFTLVELMVTLAVFAVLLGIAVPSFSAQIAQNRSQNAADGFKRVVSKARELARDNGRRTTLTVNGTPAVAGCDNAAWAITQGNEVLACLTKADYAKRYAGAAIDGTTTAALSFLPSGIGNGLLADGTSTPSVSYVVKSGDVSKAVTIKSSGVVDVK